MNSLTMVTFYLQLLCKKLSLVLQNYEYLYGGYYFFCLYHVIIVIIYLYYNNISMIVHENSNKESSHNYI